MENEQPTMDYEKYKILMEEVTEWGPAFDNEIQEVLFEILLILDAHIQEKKQHIDADPLVVAQKLKALKQQLQTLLPHMERTLDKLIPSASDQRQSS